MAVFWRWHCSSHHLHYSNVRIKSINGGSGHVINFLCANSTKLPFRWSFFLPFCDVVGGSHWFKCWFNRRQTNNLLFEKVYETLFSILNTYAYCLRIWILDVRNKIYILFILLLYLRQNEYDSDPIFHITFPNPYCDGKLNSNSAQPFSNHHFLFSSSSSSSSFSAHRFERWLKNGATTFGITSKHWI